MSNTLNTSQSLWKKAFGNSVKSRLVKVTINLVTLPFVILGMLASGHGILNFFSPNTLPTGLFISIGITLFLLGIAIHWGLNKVFSRYTQVTITGSSHDTCFYWKKVWTEGRIPDSTRKTAITLGCAATAWNLLAWVTFLFTLNHPFSYASKVPFLTAILPMTGVVLGYFAFRKYRAYRRYATTCFVPYTIPAYVGEDLVGYIETPKPLSTDQDIIIKLRCLKSTTRGTGMHRTVQEKLLWEGKQSVAGTGLQNHCNPDRIPVHIPIPNHCQPTYEANYRKQTHWKLLVKAKVPGCVAYKAEFEIPVRASKDGVAENGISRNEESF